MNTNLLLLTLGAFCLTALGQQKPAYSDADAAKHVGEEATVTGKVASVSTSKGTTFMNFGDRFPRHTFSGIIFASNEAAVGDVKQYEGKEVALTGRIELARDQKPQIIISRADQLRLASAPAPSAPAPTPTAPTPMPPPAPGGIPPSEIAGSKPPGKIAFVMGWNSPGQGGEMTRKDLAKIFGGVAVAGESLEGDTSIEVYPGVFFLNHLEVAKKAIHIDGAPSVKTKIATPGMPQASLTAHTFSGVFAGGFSRLSIITDNSDQVLSILAVEPNARTRVPNEPDTNGYHTYNFVTGRAKATNDIVVRHQVSQDSSPGLAVVDTLVIDPTDPESPPPRSSKSGSSKSSSFSKPKTGKVLERSRWFVPLPVVKLILRCVVR